MHALQCRACAAPLSSDDLDRRLAIVTCGHCGAMFDLARRSHRQSAAATGADPGAADVLPGAQEMRDALGLAAQAPVVAAVKAPLERAPVPLPVGFTVDDRGGTLRVSWRWFTPKTLFLLLFAIAWDAFLVNWYIQVLSGDGPRDLIAVVFPIAHVAVGVGLTVFVVASLLNHTAVTVNRLMLKVRHAPIPWWPAPTLPSRDLEQLYVTRKVSHNKNGTSVTFELRAVTREHHGLKLIGGLERLDQALWLEQEIERHLDIRDRAVAGEVRDRSTQI